jgi:hypothetical protein
MLLDYQALQSTPIATHPFPHVVVKNFVPADTLRQLVAELPLLNRRGSFPISAVKMGPTAAAVLFEMEGPALRNAIAEKFALNLDDAPTMLTLRGRTEATDGKIHCDSVSKRVTVLLYLNPSSADWAEHAGCLRLLRGSDSVEDFAVEVPPVDGTLLVFPNSPVAWHGHLPFTGRRYTVQLNYMTTDGKAHYELMRHRLSAFAKRLTGAVTAQA